MHGKKVKGLDCEIGLITLREHILEKGQHTSVCWQGDQFHTIPLRGYVREPEDV
jgi:hypothetical protein